MKLILNQSRGITPFSDALQELLEGAETVAAAVSYVQVGGWKLFRTTANGLDFATMRIVCTDQFDITQPAAVRLAIGDQVKIRRYSGLGVYHPKVLLAYGRGGRPSRFLVGSANLSGAAFSTSVESGILGDDRRILRNLDRWFGDLFENDSEPFTPMLLQQMEERWQRAAELRVRTRLRVKREPPRLQVPVELAPEDVDALEDILSMVQVPIGLLNMDYAANNVRTISRLRTVLAKPGPDRDSKERSELKLLGFTSDGRLTQLGAEASQAGNDLRVAQLWCQWLKETSDVDLMNVNERLLIAKRVIPRFWRLRAEVRDYFLQHLHDPRERRVLQTIELVCNGGTLAQSLGLDEIRMLSSLLESDLVPAYVRAALTEYFENKGSRGWREGDRRTVVEAWQKQP